MGLEVETIEINGNDWKSFDHISHAQELFQECKTDFDIIAAVEKIAIKLSQIPIEYAREIKIQQIAKIGIVKETALKKALKNIIDESSELPEEEEIEGMPKEATYLEKKEMRKSYLKYGFFEYRNTYYFRVQSGFSSVSNFTLKPLFHIYSKSDNKRLLEIKNRKGKCKIIDIPSKDFRKPETFADRTYEEGNFLYMASKNQHAKLLMKYSEKFRFCHELKTLGWQHEGFFAFSNGILDKGNFTEVDDYGIVSFKGENYFSPAFSKIYKDMRQDDDEYENDRYFIYKKSPISLTKWAKLVKLVFAQNNNGIIGIAYTIASMFRDLIYQKDKVFPLLYLVGQKQSGKSQLGWTVHNLFLNGQNSFNLQSATDVAFFRRIGRFRNIPVWLDEYEDYDISSVKFQGIKSAYDGIGREKGRANDKRTDVDRIESSLVLSGQYLPTRDDNSVFTRSITLLFEKKPFTTREVKLYDELRKYESEGISSIICDVLRHRELIDNKYPVEFSTIFSQLKRELQGKHKNVEERILKNFSIMLTPVKILLAETNIDIGFSYDKLYGISKTMILELSDRMSKSEGLSKFFKIVEFLLNNNDITDGVDFQIKEEDSISVMLNRTETRKIIFKSVYDTENIEVLYLKLSKIMQLYNRELRDKAIDETTLIGYMKSHDSYLGHVKSHRFTNTNTSAYAFNYESLCESIDMTLKRFGSTSNDDPVQQNKGSDQQADNKNKNGKSKNDDDLPPF